MPATIPYNYLPTVGAAGAFTIQNDGVVQGVMMDDPAVRWAIRAGVLDTGEVLPMWGGLAIYENIPIIGSGNNPDNHLGNIVGRATTVTGSSAKGLSGFSVFNQAHNMPITPQSPVPLAASGMSVNYVRLGTGARVAVACDPSLSSLEGGVVGQDVSWDFNNGVLQPYDASTPTYSVTSMTWASTNGGQIAVVMAVPSLVGAVGDVINISGATNTGTGGNSVVNGNFTVTAFTDNEHFIVAAPAAAGVIATIAGTIVVNAGEGILPVRVDFILPSNSMTVNYNALTGFATWNYAGTCAIITI